MRPRQSLLAAALLALGAAGADGPLGGWLAQPAYAQSTAQSLDSVPPSARQLEIELGGSRESLTNNLPDWSSVYVSAVRQFEPRRTLYGGLQRTRRFGLDDDEAHAGVYHPLSESLLGLLEVRASSSHNVLPVYAAFGQLHLTLARGLIANAGLKHTEYRGSDVRTAVAGGEYYWAAFRAAYTFYSARLEAAGSAPSHRIELAHYYGERNSIGISVARGRELENVGPPRGVIASDVRNWTLSGRHWVEKNWALTGDLVSQEQGTLYRRKGFRLGVRHRF